MPRLSHITHVLGGLIFVLGACMCAPLLVALIYMDGDATAFASAAALTMAVGGALWWFTRIQGEINIREGFAVVGMGWALLALFGALPYYFWHEAEFQDFSSCYFESISGLTTTGASILNSIESKPHGILFWRSFTHWLGGMGIIVLALALLPLLGYGVMQLFKAEVPGPTADKLAPRVKETAKLLWIVYALLSAIQTVLLLLGGQMDLFHALCHSFGTMATGGFSTKDASIQAYPDPYTQWVIIAFMILAGVNFTFHFHLLRFGRLSTYWKSDEFRVYLSILVTSSAIIAPFLYVQQAELGWEGAIRNALFQVAAIVTTTGFCSDDYALWPALCQMIIFILMFTGGCAGSTGGGVKVVRHLLLTRAVFAELKRMLHPRAIIPVRLSGRPVAKQVLANVQSFALLYLLLVGAGALLLCASPATDPKQQIDVLTGLSVSLSCVSNVGPAFGLAGPTDNYACFGAWGKWVCSGLMLTGRLELYTIVVLVTPAFWRKH